MKHAIKQLFTNADGRMSTTATGQIVGLVVLAGTLMISVALNRDYVPELFIYFATYCGGLTVTKGAVSAYRATRAGGEK